MWESQFSSRLVSWNHLRQQCQTQDLCTALQSINSWWFDCPWHAYHLHWNEQQHWPDPWQLLSDNIYCEVARGLGILYTMSLTQHPEIIDAEFALTEDDRNLVLAAKRKYILNWESDLLVNNNQAHTYKKIITQQDIIKKYL